MNMSDILYQLTVMLIVFLCLSLLVYGQVSITQINAQSVNQPDDNVTMNQENNSKHSNHSDRNGAYIVLLKHELKKDNNGNHVLVGQVKNIGNNTATMLSKV